MTSPEVIFTICRRTTASPYYILKSLLFGKRLHWLPVKFRIDFKILLTYMAINGLAPFYLQERINLNEASHVNTSYAPTVMDCY